MNIETSRTATSGPGVQDHVASARLLLIDCGVAPETANTLLASAFHPGAAIDRAIAEGIISETVVLTAVAFRIGATVVAIPPSPRPGGNPRRLLDDRRFVSPDGPDGPVHVLAPDGAMMLALLRVAALRGGQHLMLTTRQAFINRVMDDFGPDIAGTITQTTPAALSARTFGAGSGLGAWLRRFGPMLLGIGLLYALFVLLAPVTAIVLPPLILTPLFMVGAIAVLACLVESFNAVTDPPPLADAQLPLYTVLVPLYRESNILPLLVERLAAIDYPRERLEILLLVEADDRETRDAIAETTLPPFMLAITVPPGEPRTKPRALNAGMLVARGELVVVFDAEDAPEPDQLRRAAAIFAVTPERDACVQARLAISNARDCLLTRRFAVDYAALFDCGKAGMARLGWPVPLGGSSNHFRVAALRDAGCWDAWNVTEDADLGIRLARRGFSVQDLPSTTWEEAPNRLSGWLNQRTRWMKGWMQTMMVHARHPLALAADLGLFRALIIASFGIAVVLGALFFPVFVIGIGWRLAYGEPLGSGSGLLMLADTMLVECLVLAALAEVLPALVALGRRRALGLAPWILLAPFSYLLTSIAAWRALYDLAIRPHHWHKTSHGEARRSGGLSALRT